MNYKISPLFAVALSLSPMASSVANEPNSQKPAVIVIRPEFTFKARTLQGQVRESIQYAKQRVLGPTTQLMEVNKNKADKVLAIFERYARDKDDDVRFAVLEAASCVKTHKSLAMVIALVNDPDLGHDAINSLYGRYSRQQIVSLGGEKLRTALVRNFARSVYSNRGALLIQLFGRKKTPVDLFKRRLRSYKQSDHEFVFESLCINLALSELGDAEGVSNVAKYFDEKQVEELLLLMMNLKFVQRKAVLLRTVELLKDKRNARRAGLADGPVEYTRLCDEAMIALRLRFDPAQTPSYESVRRFTDEELLSAHKKYMMLLNGIAV